VATETHVYRWRDAAGTLHIESGPPPQGVVAERLTLHGEKKTKIPVDSADNPTTLTRGTNSLTNPASVYGPEGFEQLLQSLDKTVKSMDQQRAVMKEIEKDL
jgi:hypothetical protein